MDFTALVAPFLPFLLATGALVGIFLFPWLLASPRLAITGLFVSLLLGQLVRLPLPGQPGGLLLSDLATVVVLLVAALRITDYGLRITSPPGYWLLVTSPFLIYSLWTNLIHWSPSPIENLIALAYWLRLSATLLLLPALLVLFSSRVTGYRLQVTVHYSLLITTAVLCSLGFIQWWFFSNLSFLAQYGWDPHQGRLVSTWLDPNLFGAFLLITIPFFLFRTTTYSLLTTTSLIALLLTKSRSSLLAFGLTAFIFSPLFVNYLSKRYQKHGVLALLAITGLLVAACLVAIFFLGERARGFLAIDITAQLRLESLIRALPLANEQLLTGVGYNRYQFAAKAAGLIPNFALHSRAGADNSLLALLITTGLPGLLLFLLPWAVIIHRLVKKRSFAALFSITALLIHSQFVNSLLYSHLLIALIIVVSLALADRPTGYRLRVTSP